VAKDPHMGMIKESRKNKFSIRGWRRGCVAVESMNGFELGLQGRLCPKDFSGFLVEAKDESLACFLDT
jgi:hypothetical protein